MAQLPARNSGGGLVWGRAPSVLRQGLKVLGDGREVEFIARAGQTSQTHALEAVMGLEVRKAHFDLLPLIPGPLALHPGIRVNITNYTWPDYHDSLRLWAKGSQFMSRKPGHDVTVVAESARPAPVKVRLKWVNRPIFAIPIHGKMRGLPCVLIEVRNDRPDALISLRNAG